MYNYSVNGWDGEIKEIKILATCRIRVEKKKSLNYSRVHTLMRPGRKILCRMTITRSSRYIICIIFTGYNMGRRPLRAIIFER